MSRTRSRQRVALALTLFTALPVLTAQAGTLGFKGVLLGSPLSQVADDPRYVCHKAAAPGADTICSLRPQQRETMAGVPVDALFYFYLRGRLTRISITLPESRFARVVEALKARYGEGELHTAVVRTYQGATHQDRIHTWRQGDTSLQAQRYAGRLDKSLVRYTDEAALRRAGPSGGPAVDPKHDL